MAQQNLLFYDLPFRQRLLPITYTRPASEIRAGILTIREKWEKRLGNFNSSFLTESYLQSKFPLTPRDNNYIINGTVCPTDTLTEAVFNLSKNQSLWKDGLFIAAHIAGSDVDRFSIEWALGKTNNIISSTPFNTIRHIWDIFRLNGEELSLDFNLFTRKRQSATLSEDNTFIGNKSNLFIEPGASVHGAIFNSTSGPIYIGKEAEVMEGATVRGPFALCEHGVLKMQAKIYGATTIGPWSKVGGEINNSVIIGYSNKAHDGFLGNAVLGEWCNLGADTNNSNLKNNYAEVKIWDYESGRFVNTGEQFCGLFLGDHSKSGINTMFNTGTVVGVSANIFGAGFPRNFIPSFAWGGAGKMIKYKLDKAFEVAEKVMARRNIPLTKYDEEILSYIFEHTAQYRIFK